MAHAISHRAALKLTRESTPSLISRVFTLKKALLIVVSLTVTVVVWAGILTWKWPFTKEKVVTSLQQSFRNTVHIGFFHPTFFPLGYVAENVAFTDSYSSSMSPVATVHRLVITARYSDLFLLRKRVDSISVLGLRMVLPNTPFHSREENTSTHQPPRFSEIGQIKLEDSVIEFPASGSADDSFRVTAKRLTFDHVNSNKASPFHAELSVNEPQGTIQSSGQLGPWDWSNARQTPLSGSFSFKEADLSTVGDLQGRFTAQGKFSGLLGRVACHGTVDLPQFGTSSGKHILPLSTAFDVTVNGMNGDTTLDRAESRLDRTVVQSQGTIEGDRQHPGKVARLHFSVQDGQVDDLLLLFTKSPQPSMTGAISLQADAELPPGPPGFLQKLRLQGDFGMSGSRFTKARTQAPINHLSESAEGMDKREQQEIARTVLSNVKGHISTQNGIATLSHICFTVPGADAQMSGTYNLLDKTVHLSGTLRTTGKLSDSTSGIKAGLLTIISPFLKKHSVTTVPFTITGAVHHPAFALDLARKQRS